MFHPVKPPLRPAATLNDPRSTGQSIRLRPKDISGLRGTKDKGSR